MKHITLTGILLPAILILLQACAGGKLNNSGHPAQASAGPPDIPAPAAATGNQVYRNDIHIKAVRHFKQTFPGTEDERWYLIEKGFMAKHKVGDVNIRLDYDRYGNWLYTIRYIDEKKLPKEVRAQVRSTWYDHAITSVEEIQYGTLPLIYIVHIHEGDDWKIIRVCEGEMNEIIPPGKAG